MAIELSRKSLIIPDYEQGVQNTGSCLYQGFGEKECSQYVLDIPLREQTGFINEDANIAIVHSYGYFIFLVGRNEGMFKNVKLLLVLDGYCPEPRIFNGNPCLINIDAPGVPTAYFFPTRDRHLFPLKEELRICNFIFKGYDYGHNLIFGDFKPEHVREFCNAMLSEFKKVVDSNAINAFWYTRFPLLEWKLGCINELDW